MHSSDQIASQLPDLQDQKSFTLCWRSYSGWGRERVAHSVAWNASQYHIYEWPQQINPQITNDARPTIVDAPLTLIFRIGHGACFSLFCLKSQPIPHLWMAATDCNADYQWCKTKNRWHSVDAHFALGVSTTCYHLVWHLRKTFPSGRNGYVRVDVLRQSRQRRPSGALIRPRRQYHPSQFILLSNRGFSGSSRSVGLAF